MSSPVTTAMRNPRFWIGILSVARSWNLEFSRCGWLARCFVANADRTIYFGRAGEFSKARPVVMASDLSLGIVFTTEGTKYHKGVLWRDKRRASLDRTAEGGCPHMIMLQGRDFEERKEPSLRLKCEGVRLARKLGLCRFRSLLHRCERLRRNLACARCRSGKFPAKAGR